MDANHIESHVRQRFEQLKKVLDETHYYIEAKTTANGFLLRVRHHVNCVFYSVFFTVQEKEMTAQAIITENYIPKAKVPVEKAIAYLNKKVEGSGEFSVQFDQEMLLYTDTFPTPTKKRLSNRAITDWVEMHFNTVDRSFPFLKEIISKSDTRCIPEKFSKQIDNFRRLHRFLLRKKKIDYKQTIFKESRRFEKRAVKSSAYTFLHESEHGSFPFYFIVGEYYVRVVAIVRSIFEPKGAEELACFQALNLINQELTYGKFVYIPNSNEILFDVRFPLVVPVVEDTAWQKFLDIAMNAVDTYAEEIAHI